MSDFGALRIALSSLYAQRRGLELAGHNVANANTEGFSRQRVDMVNVGPPLTPAFFSRWTGDGGGVEVSDVIRYRDQFLEIRAALEHDANAHLTVSRAQDEVSSMKKLRKPSDSPVDTISAMRLRSDMGRNTQISRNLNDAVGWLGVADNTIQSVVEQLNRVRDLSIQARNASADSVAREAIASEIDKIRESVLGLANSQYNGRATFAGTTAAYDASANYQGFTAAIERTVAPGVRVQINVNGDEIFGAAGNDLFVHLNQVTNAVRSNPADLDTLVTDLDTRTLNIQTKLLEVGARFNRVETMKDRNSADALTMRQNLSNVEDADIAQSVMELQMQEVAYQAALQATARAIQPSLVDFLR